jgi:hypothetical protein
MVELTMRNWRELCIETAFEDNPEKLPDLVAEINNRLTARQQQLVDEIFERLGSDVSAGPHSKWLQ